MIVNSDFLLSFFAMPRCEAGGGDVLAHNLLDKELFTTAVIISLHHFSARARLHSNHFSIQHTTLKVLNCHLPIAFGVAHASLNLGINFSLHEV